ncbi:MAG: hypothetical protein ACOY3P_09640 [Planctomycetota bacterium]
MSRWSSAPTAAAPQAAVASTSPASGGATQTSPVAAGEAKKSDGEARTLPAPDSQAIQEILLEVERVGHVDRAAQAQLIEDLGKFDPALWPLMMQTFRANAADRQQAQVPSRSAQAEAAHGAQPMVAMKDPAASPAPATKTPDVPAPELQAAHFVSLDDGSGRLAASPCPPSVYMPQVAAGDMGEPQTATPHGAAEASPSATPLPREGAGVAAEQEPLARAEAPAAGLQPAVQIMEEQLRRAGPQARFEEHARLRLLRLAAGQREAALQPLPSGTVAEKEFWSQQIYGLSAWLDESRQPDAALRAAEAKRHLDGALAHLAETAPLVVKSLAFCTEIQSFGCTKPFRSDEFSAEQEVLLYAEVENFASERSAKGYHTALRSSYQIFDSRGQRVAEHDFTVTEEHCQNPRRDFFIGYHLRLPKQINPGRYTLQLSIEDLKSQKIGQSSIAFTIRQGS